MLNESTISQARKAILSRNETVAMAFVNRTEDGLFRSVGTLLSSTPLNNLESTWLGYECLVNSRKLNLADVQSEYRAYFDKYEDDL